MINYGKKAEIQPSAKDVEDNRFEQIRKAAAEKHRQLDTEAARRGAALFDVVPTVSRAPSVPDCRRVTAFEVFSQRRRQGLLSLV